MISIARTFGAPDTVPAGKQADQRVEAVAVLGQAALDDRHQVHHVRVALEGHVLRDAHAAVFRHAADVVAPQVDQHHVLGPLLLARLQFLRQALVVLGAARRAGACRRSGASRRAAPRRAPASRATRRRWRAPPIRMKNM